MKYLSNSIWRSKFRSPFPKVDKQFYFSAPFPVSTLLPAMHLNILNCMLLCYCKLLHSELGHIILIMWRNKSSSSEILAKYFTKNTCTGTGCCKKHFSRRCLIFYPKNVTIGCIVGKFSLALENSKFSC